MLKLNLLLKYNNTIKNIQNILDHNNQIYRTYLANIDQICRATNNEYLKY